MSSEFRVRRFIKEDYELMTPNRTEVSMVEKFYRLGCDIGGTFTDFVLLNDQTGEIKIYKCLTTPKDPSDAVEHGIREMEKKTPGFVETMDEVIHGTTLVINSIIERK